MMSSSDAKTKPTAGRGTRKRAAISPSRSLILPPGARRLREALLSATVRDLAILGASITLVPTSPGGPTPSSTQEGVEGGVDSMAKAAGGEEWCRDV